MTEAAGGVFSFDVATVTDRLRADGHRDISRPQWTRVVIAAGSLVDAHLAAAQMAGRRGRMAVRRAMHSTL